MGVTQRHYCKVARWLLSGATLRQRYKGLRSTAGRVLSGHRGEANCLLFAGEGSSNSRTGKKAEPRVTSIVFEMSISYGGKLEELEESR